MKRTNIRNIGLIVSLAILMMPFGTTWAWVTIGPDWAGDDTTMSLNYGEPWDTSAEDALARWNAIGASSFHFYFNNDDHDHCDRGTACIGTDGNSCEWDDFSNGDCDGSPSTALAVTKSNWIIDFCNADVLFNNQYTWTSSSRPWTINAPFEFNTVAIHEFGHALGLDHENRWVATMNCIYHANFHQIHGDDKAGCRHLYSSGSQTDISATNWVKTDNSCTTAANLVTGPTSASAGSDVVVQTVMENMGTTSFGPFNIRWYLSTNSTISTGDTVLATNTGASINGPGTITFNRTLTIPSNTTAGTYWIGVIMDYDNQIAESNESNNALEQPRSISITCPSIGTPSGVAATDGTYTDRVRVTWSSVSGASQYRIYRNTSNSSSGRVQIGTDSASPFDDFAATPGVTYYYWVRAERSCGSLSNYSSSNSGWRALTSPTPSASDGTYASQVYVNWGSVSGASYYRVYRNTSNTSLGSIAMTGWTTNTFYSDTSATPLQTYYYWVRAAVDSIGTRASAFGSSNSGYRAADCDTPPNYDYLILPGSSWGTTPLRSYIEHGCHVYRLYLLAKNSYDFSLCGNDGSGATYSGAGDGNMQMYNWQGSFLWSLSGDASCSNNATTLGAIRENWRPPSDGIYFLRVFDSQDEPADYRLAYRCICAPPDDSELPNPSNLSAGVASDRILSWNDECKALDDFDRPDGTNMGPKWIERAGNTALQYFLATATVNTSLMTYEDDTAGNHICADVYASGNGLQYAALVCGYADVNNNVFVKLQGTDQFDRLFFYWGNNGSGSAWTNEGFFDLPEPIYGAHMSAHLVGDRIIVELDTDFNGTTDHVYERGGLPMHLLGKRTGVGFYGTTPPWVDNFGIAPVKEEFPPSGPVIITTGASSVEEPPADPTQDPDYVDPPKVSVSSAEEIVPIEGENSSDSESTIVKIAQKGIVNPDAEGGAWIGAGDAPVETIGTNSAADNGDVGTKGIITPPLPGVGVLIDFDDATQPCYFFEATRLTNVYAAQGVQFVGPGGNDGGAILNQCGSFGVTGHSSPNFLAFNPSSSMSDGGVPQAPETLLFTSPMQYVHAYVGTGSSSSGYVYFYAYDADGLLVDSDSRFMASTMQSLAVQGPGIVRVEILTSSASYWVLDDLFFTDKCIDLDPPGITGYSSAGIGDTDRSIAVQVNEEVTVSSLGIKVDVDVLANMSVAIREVTGATRGQVLATAVMSVPPGDLQFHHIPIAFQFKPGVVYDIAFDIGGTWNASANVMEFFSFNNPTLSPAGAFPAGPFQVLDGGYGGVYSNSVMPHIMACVEDICPTTYDVYLDTVSPPVTLLCEDVQTPYCHINPDLAPCTTYYWQVVAENCCGTRTGPVWTFSTKHLLDLNGDNIINLLDFSTMEDNYGSGSCGPDDWCDRADVTKDGQVALDDFWYLAYYWLEGCIP